MGMTTEPGKLFTIVVSSLLRDGVDDGAMSRRQGKAFFAKHACGMTSGG
jgi:hypothetical protein